MPFPKKEAPPHTDSGDCRCFFCRFNKQSDRNRIQPHSVEPSVSVARLRELGRTEAASIIRGFGPTDMELILDKLKLRVKSKNWVTKTSAILDAIFGPEESAPIRVEPTTYNIDDQVIWRGGKHVVLELGTRFNEPWLRIKRWNDASLSRWVPAKHVRLAQIHKENDHGKR
jgi:hypothetical protein